MAATRAVPGADSDQEADWMPDETSDEKTLPAPAVGATPASAVTASPNASGDDLIEKLEALAQPRPTLCPHCGKELPRE